MKYIKTYESYRSSVNSSDEPVNEEIFGAIGKFFSNMFKKAKERINKTKGGNEVEAIYQKYLGLIDAEFSKNAKVELNIAAAARAEEDKNAVPAKKESIENTNLDKVNEADVPGGAIDDAPAADTDSKTAVEQLKTKKTILDQIVKKLKDMAIKEMDVVLKKYGGAAANPQLEIIINAKKDEFELAYLNAQIGWLEKAGDKTETIKISKQRDAIAKKVEADYKEFDTKKAVQYKEGDSVIYLLKDKKKEDYKADKKPEEQTDVVGVHKISKIEGDKFTLLDKDDKPTIVKTGAEIIGKANAEGTGEEAKAEGEYKVGDKVKFKRNNGEEAEATITKVEGDTWFFKGKDGKDLKKNMSDITSKA
jgi:hypothetical protein